MRVYKGCKSNNDGVEKIILVKTEAEKAIFSAKQKGFPECKGLYPDCPNIPHKKNKMCKTCPVLDGGK